MQRLFKEGQSCSAFPLRLVWVIDPLEEGLEVQVSISVPRKKFKRAVDRNRLRRQVREAYRLARPGLLEKMQENGVNGRLGFMIIFTAGEAVPHDKIKTALKENLRQMVRKIKKSGAVKPN